MAVTKVNGFDAPYRSQTFQRQASKITQASGLLRMDTDIVTSGGNVLIPPFEFIQNGLIVAESTQRTRPVPSESAPYFLAVSAATIDQVDDLSFQFPKSPSDVSSNQVIIGYWDGVEWRKPQIISLAAIYDDINQANIDFGKVGPVSGLKTSAVSTTFETEGGVIVDRRGLRQLLNGVAINSQVSNDVDFNRVDRIIYRRPMDSVKRIGMRQFVLGGAHALVPTSVKLTECMPSSTGVMTSVKVLIGTDNSAHILSVKGYGNVYSVVYEKYNSDRTTQLVAPTEVITGLVENGIDAAIDSTNNIHVFYTVKVGAKTNLKWSKLSSVGAVSASGVIHIHSYGSVSKPAVSYNKDLDALYIVDQVYLGAGNNKIFFLSIEASGGDIMAAPTQLSMVAGDLRNPDIFITDDFDMYVVCEEFLNKRIVFGRFDDIGGVRDAAIIVSSNTDRIGYTTLVDAAKSPRVLVSKNKVPFVTFLQDKGGSNFGMSIYTQGAAFMQTLLSPTENFSDYDLDIDDFLNGLHFILKTATDVQYVKIEEQLVQFTHPVVAILPQGIAIARDARGAMLHIWSSVAAGAYTSYDATNNIPQIGPATISGLIGNITLSSSQFIVRQSDATPLIGDQITFSGSVVGNNVSKIITNIESKDYNTANEMWLVTCDSAFASAEASPPNAVLGDFAAPDGNAVSFVKTTSELTPKAYRYDVLSSDLLLARLSWPGPVILNYGNNVGPVPSETNKIIMYGADVTFDWSAANPGALTISSGLHAMDLVNNVDYVLNAGAYAMTEGQALYLTLDLLTNPVTPQVTDITTLPWATPIQVLGIIEQGNFVPHAMLSNLDIDELEPGEVDSTGHDLPDMIRDRLGIVSDTQFQPYDNSYEIALVDNYPTAISKLDARVYDILTDKNAVEKYIIPAGPGINTYTATTLLWSAAPGDFDILVFVNGKFQAQDATGGSGFDYTKDSVLGNTKLNFTYTIPSTGATELVIFKIGKGGGHPGFLVTKQNGLPVNALTQYLNFTGSGVTASNGGSGQTNVYIPGPASNQPLVKMYKNTSGSTIDPLVVCAFDNLGGAVPADSNIFNLSDFAGISKTSITDTNFGEFYKLGNIPLALVGLGAIPGQLVYIGETPGTFSLIPPAGLTDNVIVLGRAEPEDATVPDGTATALFLNPQIFSLGV